MIQSTALGGGMAGEMLGRKLRSSPVDAHPYEPSSLEDLLDAKSREQFSRLLREQPEVPVTSDSRYDLMGRQLGTGTGHRRGELGENSKRVIGERGARRFEEFKTYQ